MSKKATKALYHAGDLVVKKSEQTHRKPKHIYAVQMNQQPHEQYITVQRDSQDYLIHEQFLAIYGG